MKPFERVILNVDRPDHGLCAGDIGTIVEEHRVTGKEPGFSVEFFDLTGRTVAVVALPASQLRTPSASDRPSTRTLAAAEA